MTSVRQKLEAARKDLLDLGLRNTLLNYRPLKSRGIQIVGEKPAEVHRILVIDERPMSFLVAPAAWGEIAASASAEEQDVLLEIFSEDLASSDDEDDGVAARHADTKLQTLHSRVDLERRLLNTFYAARSSIEEQGVNTLYVALGMLRWHESPDSDVKRIAPLILIPVELYRTDVREKFRVRYTGDEIGHNLSLEASLNQDFAISLPTITEADDLSCADYLSAVACAVEHNPRWHVDDAAVAIGFFSFSKFLMYKDLNSDLWPDDAQPAQHNIITALLEYGFTNDTQRIDEEADLDDFRIVEDLYLIRDADSSQTLAVVDAHSGRNLVIQGPPGTGKSQTISNIIANGIAHGRTILFVAEKMAALEVVKRRLDEDDIGDACLELHSNKTNKRQFLDSLRHTLELGEPKVTGQMDEASLLVQKRDILNRYCRAVNAPIGEHSVTAYEAYGHLLRLNRLLDRLELPSIQVDGIENWSWKQLQDCLDSLGKLEAFVAAIGRPRSHPFWGSRCKSALPRDIQMIRQLSQTALTGLRSAVESVKNLAACTRLQAGTNYRDALVLSEAARLLASKPSLTGTNVCHAMWGTRGERIKALVALGIRYEHLHAAYGSLLHSDAWRRDLLAVRRGLRDYGDKWWRFLVPSYRRASNDFKALCALDPPKLLSDRLRVIEAILEARIICGELEGTGTLLGELFGSNWAGIKQTRWNELEEIVEWRLHVADLEHKDDMSPGFLGVASLDFEVSELREAADATESCLKLLHDMLAKVERATEIDLLTPIDVRDGHVRFESLERRLLAWLDHPEKLHEIVRYNHLSDQICKVGLESWLELADNWPGSDSHLAQLLEFLWYNALVKCANHTYPVLAAFDGESHEKILEQFRSVDKELLSANRAHVALVHHRGLPVEHAAGQMKILRLEFGKKRRHMPIRKIMAEAGRAVQRIKPVFMMSPLSVATYIPPGSVAFDMVVFDEASQVRPVDAFGAILRGAQSIIVGDAKQLPPTSFFDKMISPEEEEDAAVTTDIRSILELFTSRGAPERMLRWHYRSRHESLIAVSNYEFYDNKLVVFPSPDMKHTHSGVKLHHLPSTIYEPGDGKRYNKGEAEVVADAVMRHAKKDADLTLGVAAFNQAQAQMVLDQVEILRRKDPSLEGFFGGYPEEPFFVKNLENVQGDERDVIFISVGYGRNEHGSLSQNFGPLNKDLGERRLNVLVTRARHRCEVFCNFKAEDIDLSRSRSRGVEVLKRYLKYAQTGLLDVPISSGRDADSPFEIEVAGRIRSSGYEVHLQVGSGGYFIDLAIVDSNQPGRYLLGVECDGASYHSARWARDRDRLRQQVLEGLGWQIHRIWSTDWFQDPDRELQKLVGSIEAAKLSGGRFRKINAADRSLKPSVERQGTPFSQRGPVSDVPVYHRADMSHVARELAGRPLHEIGDIDLAQWIGEVVQVESPVHVMEVARRITEGAGLQRTGGRILAAVHHAITYACRRNTVSRKNDFLWNIAATSPKPRDRRDLPAGSRKIELIAPEEIAAALSQTIEAGVAMKRLEAAVEAARVLGYSRVTDAILNGIDEVIGKMVDNSDFEVAGDALVVPK